MKSIVYILFFQKDRPIKSVNGKYLVFDSVRNAKHHIEMMKVQGMTFIYGNDQFDVSEIKVKKFKLT